MGVEAGIDTVLRAEESGFATRWEMPLLLVKPPEPPTAEQLEAIQQAAYDEGYARGHAEGQAAGQAAGYSAGITHAHEQAQRMRELVEHLAQPLGDIDAEVERTLIALTIELARRLVGDALQLDPALTAQTVRSALASLGAPREARVLLNPEDADVVREVMASEGQEVPWRIVADAKLGRGDCRVLTESGQVDALLDTRQASLARTLLGDGE